MTARRATILDLIAVLAFGSLVFSAMLWMLETATAKADKNAADLVAANAEIEKLKKK
jgi:hypothetical protein